MMSIVSIEGLVKRADLNGKKGRITKVYNSERWEVLLFTGEVIAIKSNNLVSVPDWWLQETKGYGSEAMMTHFDAPNVGATNMYKSAALNQVDFPPSRFSLTSFWGGSVFSFMRQRLSEQLSSQRPLRELYYMYGVEVFEGMVFSDGDKATHGRPLNRNGGQRFWPVLFSYASAGILAVYCQDQARTKSRPWLTDASRVWVFHLGSDWAEPAVAPSYFEDRAEPAVAPSYLIEPANNPFETTTVVVEEVNEFEIDSEAGSDGSWVLC